jgi:hypothetical protein
VAGAFAAQVKDQVRQSFDALAQRLSHPSGHALGQLVGELDSDAREATLRGLEALGMSEEALDFLRQYSPPQTDFERAELRRVLREALPACAAAVRAERDAILSGGTLGEITTGDLTRTFPIAAQQVAAGLEINREAVRRDGVDFGRSPTFVERSLMRHLEGAEARHVSGAIAKWLFQRAADVAFGFATGGAGLAGTIAGIGVSAATGQIDVEQARAAHTRAEAGMRAGLTSDADARRAEQAVRQAELDRNVGVASSAVQGAAGGVLDARSSAAANDAVEMVTGPMTDVAASEQPVRVHRLRGGSRGRLEGGE